ncbi:trafficking protein particle complex subunit 6A [Spea bombifrons]|uniref:trafficking protein particle complex subunit 6A n=1 Tax=Spea bombifrons TaxID=233779 RepID=UPI002349E874|nr:trafficking protein particle complex subunit 6A [Spea bombifrons]
MADETLFALLHMEIVSHVQKSAGQDEEDQGKHIRVLEGMGFRVGQGLIEKLTKDSLSSFKDELEVVKFVCKEFWTIVFKKQIDNLRTNHQGTYVLQDNRFLLLTQISCSKQYLEEAPKFLAYTCGLIKGALSNMGVSCTVSAEVVIMPACKFQVVISRT